MGSCADGHTIEFHSGHVLFIIACDCKCVQNIITINRVNSYICGKHLVLIYVTVDVNNPVTVTNYQNHMKELYIIAGYYS
jgi:hypothetical protein